MQGYKITFHSGRGVAKSDTRKRLESALSTAKKFAHDALQANALLDRRIAQTVMSHIEMFSPAHRTAIIDMGQAGIITLDNLTI